MSTCESSKCLRALKLACVCPGWTGTRRRGRRRWNEGGGGRRL